MAGITILITIVGIIAAECEQVSLNPSLKRARFAVPGSFSFKGLFGWSADGAGWH
jgi:hypothetical protein